MVQIKGMIRKAVSSAKEGYARSREESRQYKEAYRGAKSEARLAAAKEYGRKAAYAEEKRRYQQRYEPPRQPAYRQPSGYSYGQRQPAYGYGYRQPATAYGFRQPQGSQPLPPRYYSSPIFGAVNRTAQRIGASERGYYGPSGGVLGFGSMLAPPRKAARRKRKKQIIIPKGYKVVYR